MSYEKKPWADRQSEYPNRRRLTAVANMDGVYEISREEGLVVEAGDPFDQRTMNALEGRVAAAFAELTGGTVKVGRALAADNADNAANANTANTANNANNANNANTANTAKEVAWSGVSGKPATYPATAHSHTENYSATITAWTAQQNITVGGISAADNPIVDVVLSGDYGTDKARLEAWGNVTRIVTYNGGITVICYDQAPSVAIPIQIKVVR